MKNFILNSLSIFAGKRFARLYASDASNVKTFKALDTYRSLRRRLPLVDGQAKHLGNHDGSKFRPWLATQGCKVATLSNPV
jgi:hypothetical protein